MVFALSCMDMRLAPFIENVQDVHHLGSECENMPGARVCMALVS
jgi:hypothetical protein